jgi:hypothetical protein
VKRLAWAGATAIVAALALSACGGPDVTQARLEDAVGPTFARLYQRQQDLIGKPTPAVPQASATCHRSGVDAPTSGAGDDWICVLVLQVGGPQAVFNYELNVAADGCYTADGPPTLVGGKTLLTPKGASRVNPLFAFDGCFDSW